MNILRVDSLCQKTLSYKVVTKIYCAKAEVFEFSVILHMQAWRKHFWAKIYIICLNFLAKFNPFQPSASPFLRPFRRSTTSFSKIREKQLTILFRGVWRLWVGTTDANLFVSSRNSMMWTIFLLMRNVWTYVMLTKNLIVHKPLKKRRFKYFEAKFLVYWWPIFHLNERTKVDVES